MIYQDKSLYLPPVPPNTSISASSNSNNNNNNNNNILAKEDPPVGHHENLIEYFGLYQAYRDLKRKQQNSNKEKDDQTFRSYIEHLPGNLNKVIKSKKEKTSLKDLLNDIVIKSNNNSATGANSTGLLTTRLDIKPLDETQLRSAFTLSVGPISSKKKVI